MCIHNTMYYHNDCCLSSGSLHSAPVSHGDASSGERTDYHSTHTPTHTSYTSPDVDTTPSLALASVPVFSAADQSLQSLSMEDLVDIQPPPHVIDYWFELLGLSLDPTSSESGNPSDSVGFLCPFPPLDGNEYVSSLLVTLCVRWRSDSFLCCLSSFVVSVPLCSRFSCRGSISCI